MLAAADHQAAHRRVVLGGEHRLAQREGEIAVERVERARPVEGNRRHGAARRNDDRPVGHASRRRSG
jgi:hypothetical protein